MFIERGDWQFEAGRQPFEWGLGISFRHPPVISYMKTWTVTIQFGLSWYFNLEWFHYEEPEPGTLRYMEREMRQDVATGIVESLYQKEE